MTCVIKFNITTIYTVVHQNKYTYVIILFVCYIIDMVHLMYPKIFPYFTYR